MPLDSNLFTLSLSTRAANSPASSGVGDHYNWVDVTVLLPNGSSESVYSAYKDNHTITLYDTHTSQLYGTLLLPSSDPTITSNNKLRTIQLENPTSEFNLQSTGKIHWEWSFAFEEVKLAWTRDILGIGAERGLTLSISRKPDPSWPATIYRPTKTSHSEIGAKGSIQVLDFNYNRLDPSIQDKKGLEILTLLSLLSFLEASYFVSPPTSIPDPLPPIPNRKLSGGVDAVPANSAALRTSPGGPIGAKGQRSDISLNDNEIEISDPSKVEEYIERCLKLLLDPQLLYLILSSKTALTVPLVIRIAEEVKRKRYKVSAEELRQYVLDVDDEEEITNDQSSGKVGEKGKGKGKKNYAPPTQIQIYLSRIELSELLTNYNRKAKLLALKKKQEEADSKNRIKIRDPIDFDQERKKASLSNFASAGTGTVGGKEGHKHGGREGSGNSSTAAASSGSGSGFFGGLFGGGAAGGSNKKS